MLDDTADYSFILLGICSHAKDYKLCWSLNNHFGFQLEKEENDLELINGAQKLAFSQYHFQDEESHAMYSLLANKNGNGYLVPEQKQTDYFLMVRDSFDDDPDQMLARLRKMDVVLTAFSVDAGSLKSKSNLLL